MYNSESKYNLKRLDIKKMLLFTKFIKLSIKCVDDYVYV